MRTARAVVVNPESTAKNGEKTAENSPTPNSRKHRYLTAGLADVSSQHVGDGGGTRLDLRRLQREPDDEPAGGVHPAVTVSVAGIAAGPP